MQGSRKRIMSITSQTSTCQLDGTAKRSKETPDKGRCRSPSPMSRYTMRMRVMTYDIWNGGLPVNEDMEDRLEKIVSVIRKHRPDVLCIQEAN